MIKTCMKVVIDCDFAECMSDKELNSLSKQIMYCHSENKKSIKPVNLILTGWGDSSFQGRLNQHSAYNWGIDIYPKKEESGENQDEESKEEAKGESHSWYSQLFDKTKLVYLTADSPNTLESFDDDKIYIIGGIVDRNRHIKIYASTKQQSTRLDMPNSL